MKKMKNNDILAREQKKKFDVIEDTFSKYNLRILHLSIRPWNIADFQVMFELASIDGNQIPFSVKIKINIYDEDDELYDTGRQYISDTDFEGYDTFVLTFIRDGEALLFAKSGRMYVTKA